MSCDIGATDAVKQRDKDCCGKALLLSPKSPSPHRKLPPEPGAREG